MGGKVEHIYHVEFSRKGAPGSSVIATADNVSVARTTFWAAVDSKAASLFVGDEILLRHGARVILRYPPDRAISERLG